MSNPSPAKILIVDDDALTRLVLRQMLACQPEWEVVEATDGTHAWRLLAEGLKPAVCILDVNMPGLDGLELLGRIRASDEHKALSAILCTNRQDRPTIERAATLCVDYYLLKPFRKDLVITQVQLALARRAKVIAPPQRQPVNAAPAALVPQVREAPSSPRSVKTGPAVLVPQVREPSSSGPVKGGLTAFVQQVGVLPSFSTVYRELAEAVRRSDAPISNVSEIILRDQTLTSRLLKLANSAYYGAPGEVTTVESAVRLVGLQQIQDLVLATIVIDAFDNVPRHLADVRSFWKHSVATGLATALLAECRHDPVPERLFIGGLLHDIGKLVLVTHAPQESKRILERCERTEQLSFKVEREVLGFDHAMVAAELLASWNLPKGLVQMVACHHEPMKSSAPLPSDSFLVHYADFMTTALAFGDAAEQFIAPLIIPGPAERAFLEHNAVESLVSQLDTRYEAVLPIYLDQLESLKAA